MKLKKDPRASRGVLVQARFSSKTKKSLDSFEAWELLCEALKDHPELEIEQVEIRIEREEEKTSI
jgi:hypothetical protein